MKTILSVIGARPQFIKAAPVSRALRARDAIREITVHTGQHFDRDMSDVFFAELNLPLPDLHLGIHGGGHGAMTGRMMVALEETILSVKPDAVLVYGDTNSTLAGAVAAAKLFLPVAHVEAGLRSYDRRMPEELNRVVADHLSDLLLCPTTAAMENLAKEGITRGVHNVGDVMFDAAQHAARVAGSRSQILDRLGLVPKTYAVATVHRPANTDDPNALAAVMEWLDARAAEHPVVLPLHPRTRQAMARAGLAPRAVRLIEPIGYIDMASLLRQSVAVYTDSGGVQKEAYFYRVPCVTLRPNTEWVETIEAGWNRLWRDPEYKQPRREIAEYGDGNAAGKIVDILMAKFNA